MVWVGSGMYAYHPCASGGSPAHSTERVDSILPPLLPIPCLSCRAICQAQPLPQDELEGQIHLPVTAQVTASQTPEYSNIVI